MGATRFYRTIEKDWYIAYDELNKDAVEFEPFYMCHDTLVTMGASYGVNPIDEDMIEIKMGEYMDALDLHFRSLAKKGMLYSENITYTNE